MADTIGPKVCRFNFYSRQCNIHYTTTSSTRFPPVVRKMLSESTRRLLRYVFFLLPPTNRFDESARESVRNFTILVSIILGFFLTFLDVERAVASFYCTLICYKINIEI